MIHPPQFRREIRHLASILMAGLSASLLARGAWAQAQGPIVLPSAPVSQVRHPRPPDPVFKNPHTDPRDFEGLWFPGRVVQSIRPLQPGKDNAPPTNAVLPPRAPGSPPPDPARGTGPLTGPIIGMAATSEAQGSTLQCTPTWRLIGAGGGMSNYWVIGRKEIVLYAEEDQDVARKIYMDARHPAKLVPQPNGNSIGHWQGNTLVVDTTGFSNPDGSLADRHVVEHIEKHGNTLIDNAVVTLDGRKIYVWIPSYWRPDLTISQNVCEEGYRRYELRDGKVINLNTLPKDQVQ